MNERTSFVVVLHHENVSDESVEQINGFTKNFPTLTFTDTKDMSGTTVFTPGGDQTRALETIMGDGPGYMPPKMMIDLVREDDFNQGNIPGTDPVTVKAAGDDNVVDATPESLIDQFNTHHNINESGGNDILVDGDDQAHTPGTDIVANDDDEFFVPEVDGNEFDQEIDQILDRDGDLFNRMQREDKIAAFLDEILPSVRDLDGDVDHGLDLDKLNDQQRSIIESVWDQSRSMIESARSVASESVSDLDDYELDAIRLDLIDALAEADNQHINGFLADRDGLDELFEQAMREPLRARMIYEEGLRRYIQKRTEDLERTYRTRYPDNSDQVKQAVLEELTPRIREQESQVEKSRLGAIRAAAQALRKQSDEGRRVAELTRYAETEDAEKSRIRSLFDGFVAENERQAELERAEQEERERREREDASRLAEGPGRHRRRRRRDSTDLSSMVDDIRDRPLPTPTGTAVASTPAVEGSDPAPGRSTAVGALGASGEAVSRVEDEPVVESTPKADEVDAAPAPAVPAESPKDENVQEDTAPEAEAEVVAADDNVADTATLPVVDEDATPENTEDVTSEGTEDTEDTDVDVAEDVSEDETVDEDATDNDTDADVDVEADDDEPVAVDEDDIDDEDAVDEDFDEVEDFDEDAAVVEVDHEAEPVDDADKPVGLDNLDEDGDEVDTKKRNLLLAGVAVGLVVLVGGFVWPGFFTGGGDDAPPADDQAVVAEETDTNEAGDSDMDSDLSELYRVGDNITVLVGNRLTEVSIQEFLPAPEGGALAENDNGDLFIVTQSQLDRYVERNPDQFTDRAALIEDEG